MGYGGSIAKPVEVVEVYHAKGHGWEVWANVPEGVLVKVDMHTSVGNLHILIQNLQLASDAIKFYKPPQSILEAQVDKLQSLQQESSYWSQATNSPPLSKAELLGDLADWKDAMAQHAVGLSNLADSLDPEAPKEDDY